MKKIWVAFKFNTWFFFNSIGFLVFPQTKGRNRKGEVVFYSFHEKIERLNRLYMRWYPWQFKLMPKDEVNLYIKEMKESIDRLDGKYYR